MLLRSTIWSLVLILGVSVSFSLSGPHIADVNILLPPKMTNPVEYRLQGSDGCFQWSWDHHDILSVLPEYNSSNHCSTSARLRSIAPYSGRKETAIYATDVHTGILVRCRVFIDVLTRIQIFHNSVKLDLDGLATLRVRAFDSEDNVFTSLVGLQFMWYTMSATDGLSGHLVHIPLEESPLSDCGGLCGDLNVQIKIEKKGVFSDLYFVKGVKIGHEIVYVHLLEPQFEHMEDKIILTVAEAMSLDPPSPVFVLIGAVFQFGLKVIRGNIPQVVTLPSPHHRWSMLNSSIAQVDGAMGIIRALDLGVTTITVEDTRVAGHTQMSSLHVIVPDNLYLYILPLSPSGHLVEGTGAIPFASSWYVISGQTYVILLKVFSRGPGAREIYITEKEDVKMDYLSEYWEIFLVPDSLLAKHEWMNSRILRATSHGHGKLTASLTYSNGHPETTEVLKVVQEVVVCEQVRLNSRSNESQIIFLPWAPGVYQEVELLATGGCAQVVTDYKWFSSDMTTVSVSTSGIVQAKKPGKTIVKVVSIFNSDNYDEVIIEVLIPSTMLMIQNMPVETVVGSYLQAAVTMKSFNGAYFYKCDAFNPFIQWKLGSDLFVIINATGETSVFDKSKIIVPFASVSGPQCAWIYLYVSAPGHALLHATLSKDNHERGSIILKTSSRIAAYAPLKVFQAVDGNHFGGIWFNVSEVTHDKVRELVDLHLVPRSQIDVMVIGGPEPWDLVVQYIETTAVLDDKYTALVDVEVLNRVSNNQRGLYRVFCEMPGDFILDFKRGNMVGDDHFVPSLAEAKVLLSCSLPSSVAVIVDESVNAPDVIRRSIQAEHNIEHASAVTVANGRTIRIAAVGISNTGKAFANSSSLYLNWELNSCEGLAYWNNTYEHEMSKSSWERFLVLQDRAGLCIVHITVTGFHDTTMDQRFIQLQGSEGIPPVAVRLQLVSTLNVEPSFKLLFFSPDSKVNLSIYGGSCFMESFVNDSQVVEIIEHPTNLHCSQLILASKGMGTALVTVYDVGLSPPLSASSLLEVADIDWIKINSQEEIHLMEGSLNYFNLLAGVRDGRMFDSSQYVFIKFHLHTKDRIVDLVDDRNFSSLGGGYFNGQTFIVMAMDIGVTTLYVSARQQSGDEILSEPIKVEVYTPPRIHPNSIILVPGAFYVVTVKGGPTVGANVEYASIDSGTATIHKSSGGLSAISPGNTTLVAKIYGNANDLICQTYAQVKIIVPSSMILSIQSGQLGVGREMPIYPSLHEGDLFSFYGLCKDFKWSIEDEKVLSFQVLKHQTNDIYGQKEVGYMDEKDLTLFNMLFGRSAGRTSVSVSFSCDFVSSGSFSESRSYSASVSLWVVSDLPLALGVPITWILPPYYTSSSLLPASSELSSQWDSQSHKVTINYSLLRACGGKHGEPVTASILVDGNKIKTTESNNVACIQANDLTTGKVEIAACIRVAEVAQLRITSRKYPLHVIDLSVGAEVLIPVKYCDVLGNPFLEAYDAIFLDVQTNRPDILSVSELSDNGSIRVKGAHQGAALLRVSIQDNLQKSDYMLIFVGAHLYPQNPVLHQGSSLNFSIEGYNNKVFGRWWSSNESVIYVDAQCGKANAIGEGITQVYFEGSGLALKTAVSVLSGDMIFVNAPQGVLTNAPFPPDGYNFPVMFSSQDRMFKARGNNKEFSYDCRVQPHYIGYAKPWTDVDTGNLYCRFFPYSPEQLEHYAPISKDAKPDVYISMNVSVREASHVSASASALFVGGFSILGMNTDTPQFNFSQDYNRTIITVVGNTGIEIRWQNRDMIGIIPMNKNVLGIGGRAEYEIRVLGSQRFNENVIIFLPANGQRVEVGVWYDPGGMSQPSALLWKTLLISLMLVILTAGLLRYYLSNSADPISMGTPEQQRASSSSPPSIRHSPPVFVDYVRRTLDESPNYTRRRFRTP